MDEWSLAKTLLPMQVLPPIAYPAVLYPPACGININQDLLEVYLQQVLPGVWLAIMLLHDPVYTKLHRCYHYCQPAMRYAPSTCQR